MQLIEFGSIMNMAKGKKPVNQSPEKRDGFLPYVDIKAFETNTVDNYTDGVKCLPCEEGDILIVCDGSRSGLVGKAINGYVGSTLAKITADGMTQNYLYYFLQGKYALLNTKKKGTGTPHLNPDLLKKQMLIVPSIPEQKRIVTHIEELFSELDKAVETLRTTKQQLAVYRQAVLKEAFSHISYKKPIREMTTIVTSGSRGWAKYYADFGARFIRITDLTRDRISLKNDSIQYVSLPEKAEGTRSRLYPNDVLISITADLGSIALVRFTNPTQGEYMAWYLKSEWGKKDLLKNKRGGGKLGLGLDDIRNTPVPVVSDEIARKTLEKIESRLSVCESIEQTVDTALAQADAMRQSILKQAFEGGF